MGGGGSFWHSLGGLLAGVGAVLTAIATLVGVLYQLDRSGPQTVERALPGSPPPRAEAVREPTPVPHPTPQAAATAPTPTEALRAGTAVLARWSDDSCLYPAHIVAPSPHGYLIRYEFGLDAEVPAAALVVAVPVPEDDLSIGAHVLGKVEGLRTRWVPSIITDRREEDYLLAFEPNAACVPGQTHTWVDAGRIRVSDKD